jgi:hypothetical protein
MNTAPAPIPLLLPLAKPSLEALAVAHYEQVYAVCHAFHDDPAVCLSLANQAFRNSAAEPDLVAVGQNLAHLLTGLPGGALPAPSHPLRSNLAWLLKDLMDLRYADIGAALDMDAEWVRREIASVRKTLLALVAESAPA